jgi:hypothetical protein
MALYELIAGRGSFTRELFLFVVPEEAPAFRRERG